MQITTIPNATFPPGDGLHHLDQSVRSQFGAARSFAFGLTIECDFLLLLRQGANKGPSPQKILKGNVSVTCGELFLTFYDIGDFFLLFVSRQRRFDC